MNKSTELAHSIIDDKIRRFIEKKGRSPNMLFIDQDIYLLLLKYFDPKCHNNFIQFDTYRGCKITILKEKGCYVCDGM